MIHVDVENKNKVPEKVNKSDLEYFTLYRAKTTYDQSTHIGFFVPGKSTCVNVKDAFVILYSDKDKDEFLDWNTMAAYRHFEKLDEDEEVNCKFKNV